MNLKWSQVKQEIRNGIQSKYISFQDNHKPYSLENIELKIELISFLLIPNSVKILRHFNN